MAGIITQRKAEEGELLPRHILFLHHYVEMGFDVGGAAERTGITRQSAYGLLQKRKARAWLANLVKESAASPAEIIARITAIARTSMADFIDVVDGFPRVNWEKAKITGGLNAIKKLKYNEQGMPEFEFYSKLEALQLLAKVMGMLVDRSLIEVDASLKIRVDEVRNNMSQLMNDPSKLQQAIELAKALGGKAKTLPAPIEATATQVS